MKRGLDYYFVSWARQGEKCYMRNAVDKNIRTINLGRSRDLNSLFLYLTSMCHVKYVISNTVFDIGIKSLNP